jgi:hypothetical protein
MGRPRTFREQRFYRYYNGVEFTNVNTLPLQSRAQAVLLRRVTITDVERFYPRFPMRAKIIKTKSGWWVMANNTVHNMNYWERTGKLPKKR